MKNKSSKIILTLIFVGVIIFGASFVKAQTTNEDYIKALQSLIQLLTQMVAQLQAQLTQRTTTTTLNNTQNTSTDKYCLDWDFFSDNAYKDGQAHEEIKRIQEKLGVNPVGGHYGPKTQAAIEAFNKKYDIHQEIDCCFPTKDYTQIYQGTIAKFNELYCDKPQYQIIITRKNNPITCSNGSEVSLIQARILNYPDEELRIPANNQPVIMKVPYSSGVKITMGAEIIGNENNQSLNTYMSKIYNNNILVAYYDNSKFKDTSQISKISNFDYAPQINTYCHTVDPRNFQYFYNPWSGLQLIINNIKSNYNILIETEGCLLNG